MSTFNGHVVSEAVQDVDASETTADLTTGETLIEIAAADDFHEGSYCRIDGEVYHYDDELTDDGEESGVPSITIDAPGLLADVAEGTAVESWNPNAKGGLGDVNCDWKVQVAPDADSETDGHPATLSESLVPTTSTDMPLMVGDAVLVEALDDGSWLVLNKLGGTPGIDPAYFRTGTIQADTEITVGDPDGQRVNLSGTDLIRAYDSSNVQTVNIDGENNYMLGTLATAASGPRVEVGSSGGIYPYQEMRVSSGSPNEIGPAKFSAGIDDLGGGVDLGLLDITAHVWDGDVNTPLVRLATAPSDASNGSSVDISADRIGLDAVSVVVEGALDAGSLAPGMQALVDARVTALAGSGGTAFAFFMGA